MDKKVNMCMLSIAIITLLSFGWKDIKNPFEKENLRNELIMSNVEALTENGEETPHEPSWWDFFNNYVVEERIPVTTQNCVNGILSYKGVQLKVGNCTSYSYAIYWHCYDGGHNDECTSSGNHGYI